MRKTDTTKIPGVNSGAREGLAVLASYKTPVVLLVYSPAKVLTVIEEKNIYVKSKRVIGIWDMDIS